MPPLPKQMIFKDHNKRGCHMDNRADENGYTPELTETEWQVIQMLSLLEDMSEDTWLKAKMMMEAMALKQNNNFRRFTEILFRVSAHERERSGIRQA